MMIEPASIDSFKAAVFSPVKRQRETTSCILYMFRNVSSTRSNLLNPTVRIRFQILQVDPQPLFGLRPKAWQVASTCLSQMADGQGGPA